MRTSSVATLFIALLVAFFPCAAAADQIRITDEEGLVRALWPHGGKATVEVTIEGEAPRVVLSNTDGILPEIAGREVAPHTYQFQDVPEGNWQIKASKGIVIRNVTIR